MSVTRTPPEQKWLLNELAVVKGELQAIEGELGRLLARKTHLANLLSALDNVYSQVAPTVPEAPGLVVHGHTRYGGRGNCIKWVREVLQEAYPLALDTAALTLAAEEAFGLAHVTPAQRSKFRNNSLRTALRTLLSQGAAERLHDYKGVPHRAGVWRWVPPEPTYAEVVAQAEHAREQAWP
jgi:hypothetical protein